MDFSTLSFGLFFLVVITIYWLTSARWRWLVLLIASYIFLSWWYLALPMLVLSLTLLSYCSGLIIEKFPKSRHLTVLIASLTILGTLFFFKYLGFFATTLPRVAEPLLTLSGVSIASIILPVGISFYTFQILGYVFDVYTKKIKAENHLGLFALFILFFPKFVAGPIEKAQQLIPQFLANQKFKSSNLVAGLMLFTSGLFKKVVVADNLALVVNRVFETLPEYRGLSLVLVIFFYAWQIYADFSGYTDMARGVAKTFGIELMENFNHPYFATSLRDFWRRWHISLSLWLREYIYFPLGGSRVHFMRTILNTVVVFLVCGLWHGAAWTFLIWGLWHGLIVAIENILRKLGLFKFKLPRVLKMFYSFVLVCIGWVFFRATSFHDAFYILHNSVSGLRHVVKPEYVLATIDQLFESNFVEVGITFSALGLFILYELWQFFPQNRQRWQKVPAYLKLAFYSALVFTILVLRNPKVQTFIYVQF